ncbi:hypothetical protein B0H10DRAFT_1959215 [Mycena sp. CBHHK59/15]|nr:hypothetical protein B0H10DRAFT_1959215 [Mycena sp. CBHHK59/15]
MGVNHKIRLVIENIYPEIPYTGGLDSSQPSGGPFPTHPGMEFVCYGVTAEFSLKLPNSTAFDVVTSGVLVHSEEGLSTTVASPSLQPYQTGPTDVYDPNTTVGHSAKSPPSRFRSIQPKPARRSVSPSPRFSGHAAGPRAPPPLRPRAQRRLSSPEAPRLNRVFPAPTSTTPNPPTVARKQQAAMDLQFSGNRDAQELSAADFFKKLNILYRTNNTTDAQKFIDVADRFLDQSPADKWYNTLKATVPAPASTTDWRAFQTAFPPGPSAPSTPSIPVVADAAAATAAPKTHRGATGEMKEQLRKVLEACMAVTLAGLLEHLALNCRTGFEPGSVKPCLVLRKAVMAV